LDGGGDHKAGDRNAIGDRPISSGKTCFQILGELGTENCGAIQAKAPFSVCHLVTEKHHHNRSGNRQGSFGALRGTCCILAEIDEKSVISPKPLAQLGGP
jgi:hypothetical protein